MEYTLAYAALAVLLAASITFNIIQFSRRKKPSQASPALSALDLLHDLTQRGSSILRVEVLDPSSLLLRSPRR